MQQYKEFAPTGMDPRGMGLPDRQDWWVAPCATNRDAKLITESNWESMLELLREATNENDGWEIHRFGHWGPGWIEIVLVDPERDFLIELLSEVEGALEGYPVLSDSDYSSREYEAMFETWEHMSLRDRVDVCAEKGVSVFAARRDDTIPQGVCAEDLGVR